MDDEAAFLRAIRERPDDDLPRLIFADWLEEHAGTWRDAARDFADRAEFIRLQCAMARNDEQELKHWPDPDGRRGELLSKKNRAEWEQPLRALGAPFDLFRRGFPEAVTMSASDFARHAGELFDIAPIRQLKLYSPDDSDAPVLAAFPHMRNLTMLDLGNNNIGSAGISDLATSPHLKNLTTLNLGYNPIGDASARALAESPHMAKLTTLDLSNNHIGDDGALALAASPHLAKLTTLNLNGNLIGDDGARALAASPHLAKLTTLDISWNGIGDDGARALVTSPHLANLTTLNLNGNLIGPALRREIERTLAARRRAREPGPVA
jgi:uncharacterized protein (TIGR02996 family)